jgi:mevalonate kinase
MPASSAFGAKLSGGGLGGNMIALVYHENSSVVAQKLRDAGAISTIEMILLVTKRG